MLTPFIHVISGIFDLIQVCKSVRIDRKVQVSLCLTCEKLTAHLHLVMFASKAKVPHFKGNFVLLGKKEEI